ncbi:MAG: ClpXP protease specificity-enhancing factor SspB [Proteobacteria bacterium]|nr:ClpXP protease specificity-enhancing factor SspB [Pseudomonadota bacterium]MDA1035047.1 ClpXP protease specificity-enhancing factor SspB [Pseudomonadota bacterium]
MDLKKPYLIKAIYKWCADYDHTPLIIVNPIKQSIIPQYLKKSNEITFNISQSATKNLHMGKETISFSARFNGVEESLIISYSEIAGIFSKESQDGLFFDKLSSDEEVQRGIDIQKDFDHTASVTSTEKSRINKKPYLKIIK